MSRIRTKVRPRLWSFFLGVAALFAVHGWTAVTPVAAQLPTGAETCPPPLPSVPTPAPPVILPTHPPAPEQVLVCVGSRAITGATFEHWSAVASKSEGSHPKHPLAQGELIGEVMKFLISSDWVLGEAQALHAHVSATKVRRAFERIRKEQFHTRKEFEVFLSRSGETVADLMLRVKLNLLSLRIQQHILTGDHSKAAKQRALARFVEGFKGRWIAQTYCSPEYSSADCGHIQAPPL